jgi:hypothetical protein
MRPPDDVPALLSPTAINVAARANHTTARSAFDVGAWIGVHCAMLRDTIIVDRFCPTGPSSFTATVKPSLGLYAESRQSPSISTSPPPQYKSLVRDADAHPQ